MNNPTNDAAPRGNGAGPVNCADGHSTEAGGFDRDRMFPPGTEPLRDFVASVAASVQFSESGTALLALGIISGVNANVVTIQGCGDHTEPAQIWTLVLAESGSRKTSIVKLLMGPVFDWQDASKRELEPKRKQAEYKRKRIEKQIAKLEQKIVGGESTEPAKDEQKMEMLRKSIPHVPHISKLAVTDPTP